MKTFKTFKAFSIFEQKRFNCWNKIAVFLAILVVALYFVQDGISQYNQKIQNKKKFQDVEKIIVNFFNNYTQYGTFGIKILFFPNHLSAFLSNSGKIQDQTTVIDTGARLQISNPSLGRGIFTENSLFINDFSGYILLIVSIGLPYMGFEAFRDMEFFRLLTSLKNYRTVYFSYIGAKIRLFSLLVAVTMECTLLLMVINNLSLSLSEIFHVLVFTLTIIGTGCIFFLLGTIAATFQSKFLGITAIIAAWFFLMIFIPAVSSRLISKKAASIPSPYEVEKEKLNILMDFDKRSRDELKKHSGKKEREKIKRQLIEEYWEKDFRKIQAIEERMEKKMMDNYKYSQWISIVFPTTFYRSLASEISSQGIGNFFAFYRFSQKKKEGFLRYYFDKKFYSESKEPKSYIQGDENIFFSKSRLPSSLLPGVAILLAYILIFLKVSYTRLKRKLLGTRHRYLKNVDTNKKYIQLSKGTFKEWIIKDEHFKNHLFTIFSGKFSRDGKESQRPRIIIDNIDLASIKKRIDFLYLCHPGNIPRDIRVYDLEEFLTVLMEGDEKIAISRLKSNAGGPGGRKKFGTLTCRQKGEILIAIMKMKHFSIYLLNDVVKDMPVEIHIRLKETMEEMANNGSLVIFLLTNPFIIDRSSQVKGDVFESDRWSLLVENFKKYKDGI